jgi:hypothetical protein
MTAQRVAAITSEPVGIRVTASPLIETQLATHNAGVQLCAAERGVGCNTSYALNKHWPQHHA